MGVPTQLVLKRLPQKPPFLFVDNEIEHSLTDIKTSYHVTGEEDFFKGHFPDNPIMPGVLLQEAAFQSGALLMSYLKPDSKLGVVSRVSDVKFKNFVKPNDTYSENHWLYRFKELSVGVEIFNLFNNQNSITNTWVRDVDSKQQFAIPNFMTSRVLNLKLNMQF